MNIDDEIQLRASLGTALDRLDPGPLPLDAVVRQGRTVVIRRRALAAAAVVIVAAAAVTVPKLVHIASQPPTSPLRYHVTVNPPVKGASKHLIASGTVSKLRWTATGSVDSQDFYVCWHVPAAYAQRLHAYDGSWCDGDTLPGPAFPTAPATLTGGDGPNPVFFEFLVRADIRRLRVSLNNGQTVILRPVRVFGAGTAGVAAVAVPSHQSITEIQAYSATREVGYTIPFTAPTDAEIVTWLKPGQPAVPRPARYTIASGQLRGQPWTYRLYVGPWGLCLENTGEENLSYPSFDCVAMSVDNPPATPTSLGNQDYSADPGVVGFDVIMGSRDFSYLVVRPAHRSPFLVRPFRVGAARFVVLAYIGYTPGPWTAYSAGGVPLASNSGN